MEIAMEIGAKHCIFREQFTSDKAFIDRLCNRLMGKECYTSEMLFLNMLSLKMLDEKIVIR